jgi:YesN/AraC family two-component response regulator
LQVNQYAKNIPVVILSGLNDLNTATDAIALGAQDFLMKGEFNEKLLEKTILYSIERKKTLLELRFSNERYEFVSKATNDLVWDWDVLSNKVYRNEEQFVEMQGTNSGIHVSIPMMVIPKKKFWAGLRERVLLLILKKSIVF